MGTNKRDPFDAALTVGGRLIEEGGHGYAGGDVDPNGDWLPKDDDYRRWGDKIKDLSGTLYANARYYTGRAIDGAKGVARRWGRALNNLVHPPQTYEGDSDIPQSPSSSEDDIKLKTPPPSPVQSDEDLIEFGPQPAPSEPVPSLQRYSDSLRDYNWLQKFEPTGYRRMERQYRPLMLQSAEHIAALPSIYGKEKAENARRHAQNLRDLIEQNPPADLRVNEMIPSSADEITHRADDTPTPEMTEDVNYTLGLMGAPPTPMMMT
jgi:hypothetical protein